MRLTFLGSGDAFGSGGRLNTCFLVERGDEPKFLVDCGASSMIAIRHFGVDPNTIGSIIISHLHGDHFGGIPFFILDGQLVSRRTQPLVIAGPPGLTHRVEAMMEACFPGSSKVERKFQVELIELEPEGKTSVGDISVIARTVVHPSGTPSLALRLACDGKVLAYTGDTEWVDALTAIGLEADVFIAEAYFYEKKVRFHLDYATLREHLPEIRPKRLIITHMSADMLDRLSEIDCEAAYDGLAVEIL